MSSLHDATLVQCILQDSRTVNGENIKTRLFGKIPLLCEILTPVYNDRPLQHPQSAGAPPVQIHRMRPRLGFLVG
uniref:Uncharacterized protein n=1 Tax=Knipowitschia caucasica TaxID=637954 RepID=A0AAV2JJV9_KNICA